MMGLVLKCIKIGIFLTILFFVSQAGFWLFTWEDIVTSDLIREASKALSTNPKPEDAESNIFVVFELICVALSTVAYALVMELHDAYKSSRALVSSICFTSRRALSLLFKIYLGVFLFLILPDLLDYDSYYSESAPYADILLTVIHCILSGAAYIWTIRWLRPGWRKMWQRKNVSPL